MEPVNKWKKLLKAGGYSVTKPRLAVFETLQRVKAPIPTVALADLLPEIDRASVYRSVELFESSGIIHRVWTGFKSKVELSEEFSPHHHHFSCLGCGRLISLESETLENNLKKLEQTYGFKLVHHSIELSGRCETCRQA